jgi:hypothetical protein
MIGALYFNPLETKMIRIVARLTSAILARKMSSGRMTQMNIPELMNDAKFIMAESFLSPYEFLLSL